MPSSETDDTSIQVGRRALGDAEFISMSFRAQGYCRTISVYPISVRKCRECRWSNICNTGFEQYKTSSKISVASVAAVLATSAAAYSGPATYYLPDGGTGACGSTIQNSDYSVALNTADYASGANCGKNIGVSYNGNYITVSVQDECPGCGEHGIDLTSDAFAALADLSVGEMTVTWDYV